MTQDLNLPELRRDIEDGLDIKSSVAAALLDRLERAEAPVTDEREAFEAWAKEQGLIQESHGLRSVNSMCDIAKIAWDARASRSPAGAAVPEGFVWPKPPPRKGQSPVLFDDGYEEGWAKCIDTVRAMLAAPAAPSAPTEPNTAAPVAQASQQPVYQYRQKGSVMGWLECDEDTRERMEKGPAAHCFEYRTLYLAAPLQQAEGAQDWIPLDERKPQTGEVVLVALDNGTVTTGQRHGSSWHWIDAMNDGDDEATATHWQPIPAAPLAISGGKQGDM